MPPREERQTPPRQEIPSDPPPPPPNEFVEGVKFVFGACAAVAVYIGFILFMGADSSKKKRYK
jgi:hypothetical protein